MALREKTQRLSGRRVQEARKQYARVFFAHAEIKAERRKNGEGVCHTAIVFAS